MQSYIIIESSSDDEIICKPSALKSKLFIRAWNDSVNRLRRHTSWRSLTVLTNRQTLSQTIDAPTGNEFPIRWCTCLSASQDEQKYHLIIVEAFGRPHACDYSVACFHYDADKYSYRTAAKISAPETMTIEKHVNTDEVVRRRMEEPLPLRICHTQ